MLHVVCFRVKPVGKPDAVVPHVRFDERGWETGLYATAPVLDSTVANSIKKIHHTSGILEYLESSVVTLWIIIIERTTATYRGFILDKARCCKTSINPGENPVQLTASATISGVFPK